MSTPLWRELLDTMAARMRDFGASLSTVQAQVAGKQDALVAGSGVTLNGTTLTAGTGGTGGSGSVAWDDVTGKPTTFTPASHTHAIGDTVGLQTALDGKQDTLVAGAGVTLTGTTLTAGGGDPWTVVRLDTTFETTTTANSAVTGLSFAALAADTQYWFTGVLFLQTAATATGARPGLSWPGGTTQEAAWVMAPNSATAFASRLWGAPTTQNAASTGLAAANEGWFARIEGTFVTGASPTGSLQVTLASETAGTTVRCMANSFLAFRTIS